PSWETGGACGRGKAVQATVEHREPCDSRGSCTVLGAPGGEIPPGDSTRAAVLHLRESVSCTPASRRSGQSNQSSLRCHYRTFNHLNLDRAVITPSAARSQRLGAHSQASHVSIPEPAPGYSTSTGGGEMSA